MSQYQATLAAVQVILDNARTIVVARDAQTPYVVRNIEVLESRVGAVTLDVLRALTTLEIVACRETQGLSIHNGREYLLRISHEGALIHFNNESGTLAGNLTFLLERIAEARGTQEIALSQIGSCMARKTDARLSALRFKSDVFASSFQSRKMPTKKRSCVFGAAWCIASSRKLSRSKKVLPSLRKSF